MLNSDMYRSLIDPSGSAEMMKTAQLCADQFVCFVKVRGGGGGAGGAAGGGGSGDGGEIFLWLVGKRRGGPTVDTRGCWMTEAVSRVRPEDVDAYGL